MIFDQLFLPHGTAFKQSYMLATNRIIACFLFSLLYFAGCRPAQLQQGVYDSNTLAINEEIEEDSATAAVIAPYKENLEALMSEKIGEAAHTLTDGKTESTLGNFVADLTQVMAQKYWEDSVDMGAVTTGGLRVPIAEGDIAIGDIFELMPFENMVVVLKLNNKEMLALAAYLAERQNLALSNTTILVKNNQVEDFLIGGKPLEENRHYYLAISDYLAGGGDDMLFLKTAERAVVLDLKVRDAIIEHIKSLEKNGQQVTAEIEGRVKILDNEQ